MSSVGIQVVISAWICFCVRFWFLRINDGHVCSTQTLIHCSMIQGRERLCTRFCCFVNPLKWGMIVRDLDKACIRFCSVNPRVEGRNHGTVEMIQRNYRRYGGEKIMESGTWLLCIWEGSSSLYCIALKHGIATFFCFRHKAHIIFTSISCPQSLYSISFLRYIWYFGLKSTRMGSYLLHQFSRDLSRMPSRR